MHRICLKDVLVQIQEAWIFKRTCFPVKFVTVLGVTICIADDTSVHLSVIEHRVVTLTRFSPEGGQGLVNQLIREAFPTGETVALVRLCRPLQSRNLSLGLLRLVAGLAGSIWRQTEGKLKANVRLQ